LICQVAMQQTTYDDRIVHRCEMCKATFEFVLAEKTEPSETPFS